jgi:predicted ATPase
LQVELTIKNYRCFPDHKPARFTLKSGFTAFVGPNNSGKSSILKFFYEFRNLLRLVGTGHTSNFLQAIRSGAVGFGYNRSVTDPSEVFCDANDRAIVIECKWPESPGAHIEFRVPRPNPSFEASVFLSDGAMPRPNSAGWEGDVLVFNGQHRLRIAPIVQAFKTLAEALYVGPFRNVINTGTNDDYFDIQVGQAFVQAWRNYKSGDQKQANRSALRVTSDIERVFGFNRLEINAMPGDATLQIIIDGRSYKLNEVGAGIAQFVIVLINAAIKQPSLILIDEPELNLHPSLQLDFLTTLASYAREGIVFSTHSYGLARSIGDSVYGVRRIGQGESEVYPLESIPRLSEFLGEMTLRAIASLVSRRSCSSRVLRM